MICSGFSLGLSATARTAAPDPAGIENYPGFRSVTGRGLV